MNDDSNPGLTTVFVDERAMKRKLRRAKLSVALWQSFYRKKTNFLRIVPPRVTNSAK